MFDNIDHTRENWYISLSNRDCISFNPGIWANDVFINIGYKKIINIPPATYKFNPERTCCNVGKDPYATRKSLDTFYSFNSMKDIGRQWQQENINGKRTFQIK